MLSLLQPIMFFAIGFALGGIFFGGLWWTVRMAMSSQQPGLWFGGSLLIRMAIVLCGFILVLGDRWERLAWCLVGFIAARVVVITLTRAPKPRSTVRGPEASHAP